MLSRLFSYSSPESVKQLVSTKSSSVEYRILRPPNARIKSIIVEAHQGSITANSIASQGATFTIDLPAAKSDCKVQSGRREPGVIGCCSGAGEAGEAGSAKQGAGENSSPLHPAPCTPASSPCPIPFSSVISSQVPQIALLNL